MISASAGRRDDRPRRSRRRYDAQARRTAAALIIAPPARREVCRLSAMLRPAVVSFLDAVRQAEFADCARGSAEMPESMPRYQNFGGSRARSVADEMRFCRRAC